MSAVGELYIGAGLNGYTVAGQQLSAAAAQDTACGTYQYVAVLGFHTKFSADPGQHDARMGALAVQAMHPRSSAYFSI